MKIKFGDLTPREEEVLDILRDRRNWRPPTLSHIGVMLGGLKHTTILQIIKQLRRKQKISGWDYTPIEWVREKEGHTTCQH